MPLKTNMMREERQQIGALINAVTKLSEESCLEINRMPKAECIASLRRRLNEIEAVFAEVEKREYEDTRRFVTEIAANVITEIGIRGDLEERDDPKENRVTVSVTELLGALITAYEAGTMLE